MNKLFNLIKYYQTVAYALCMLTLNALPMGVQAATSLTDLPILAATSNVTGNVALALSVEWPTAEGSAYSSDADKFVLSPYNTSDEFLGYFDANKCYTYAFSTATNLTGLIKNTGLNSAGDTLLSVGADDANWTATTNPNGGDINNVTTTGNSTSAFIGSTNNAAQGNYTYQTTFTIPADSDPSKISITFDLWANSLSNILVNGTPTNLTSTSSATTSASVTLAAGTYPLVNGTNTLSIVINNTGTTTFVDNNYCFFCGCPSGTTFIAFNPDFTWKCRSTTTSNAPITFRIANITVTESPSNGNYFQPIAKATNHECTNAWSGNFLNWALTQTIDPFRAALTGGYRSVDKISTTILEKAWHSGVNDTPVIAKIESNPTLISKSTPFSFNSIYLRIKGLGNTFRFSDNANNFNNTATNVTSASTPIASGGLYSMFARVRVCDATTSMGVGGLESNCVRYGNNYKPEGLIQKTASTLNFAAFGYVLDSTDYPNRDGGVLRAKMAALGSTSNNPEWSATTGIFFTNPNPTDASNSGVTNSGVINYLNKFGETSKGYKLKDPVSELYYTARRYFKKQGNVAAYTSGLTDAYKDGFPVITDWNDPISNKCQKNFILGIGDSNSWADADLPGSTIYTRTSREPSMQPTEVANDTTVNVRTATNTVGDLEGINSLGLGNLGEINTGWCCESTSTFFIAGLAYDSHTQDIRSDLTGTQSITTYWLDVLERGDRKDDPVVGMRNQFWLAAKYGGFTGATPATKNDLKQSQWDTNNDGDPDNYFRANRPSLMISGLTNAFNNISNVATGAFNSFSFSSPLVGNGSLGYSTGFDSGSGWIGDITAYSFNFTSDITLPTKTEQWHAQSKLETQLAGTGWSSNRWIATASCSGGGSGTQSCTGKPFTFADLNSTQKTALGSTSTTQQNVLNYLRGDRTNETSLFRKRSKLLGDIVNSKVVIVGPPSQSLSDSYNPGYSSFKSTYSSRKTVAYVGANDGMLHAFDASSTGGNELFAYVPNAVFNGPNSTPSVDGIAALSSGAYSHHFYVDATPIVADVNFGASNSDWHSLLIGGLGKGGKSYFAIDVTNPNNLSNQTNLANAVEWEFTHNDMGYTYGRPIVIKVAATSWLAKQVSSTSPKETWVVVLTSGYNNSSGKGVFFFVKPSDGSLIAKIEVAGGSSSVDAGLARASAFISDARAGLADAVYAGDLLGNVWRVDLTDTNNAVPSALKIAELKDSSGIIQPITTSPVIEIDSSGKRIVFVGTGKLLHPDDFTSTQSQTFYAINDGTLSKFYTASTLPTIPPSTQVTFPITRSLLVNNTSTILTGVVSDATKPMGYYIELGKDGTKPYFINVDMASGAGAITFIANSVDASNVCEPTGKNQVYSISYNGKSVLTGSGNTTVKSLESTGLGTSIALFKFVDSTGTTVGSLGGMICTGTQCYLFTQTSSSKAFTQLNWRELQTAE